MKKLFTLISILFFSISFSQDIDLESFATGFNRPVNIKHAGDDRLFVAEQDGIIKIVNSDGTTESTNFLDITSLVGSVGNEQGLLGLAFHPNYATNGYFFVNYTNNSGDTVISRFSRIGTSPEIADPNSELIILTYTQPYSNHNGGELHFSPDGYLYISSGDGGSGGDPDDNGQSLNTLLGKLLRIDVNNSTASNPYDIPSDNPFVGNTTVNQEIWAYGLRNAWKFSFDSMTDDLWIADVGQNAREEINQAAITEAGLNYGWRCYEGNNTYNTTGCPNSSTLTFPIYEYAHSGGRCSITGGYVYRGSTFSNMNGLYFFADLCTQEIGYLNFEGGSWNATYEVFSGNWVAFGEDVNNELYVADLNGSIYKIIDNTLSINENTLDSISIYPNPASHILHLDFSNNLNSLSADIKIYDIQGKLIKSILKDKNDTFTSIEISNMKSGFYIVKINSEDDKEITKKLVIN
ncbi:PQQ-dependent sugar dehydrogenase [Winogradskyella sp. SYSU M77433]|uniref:PQQ-dependent sugar dehydrogenase n=1 Tax=Winogradskyella sp. SYSU M77433 TaxID=3042722 RepID=UPI002480407F|nr:PQQ-dependent sugar dehydrogenase [Winogradskyella sp. SYSU M77433]MDH7914059.1 PQQ-dependent sugar dehydrogenase [Winogradskyella sp. SYSU M77433]